MAYQILNCYRTSQKHGFVAVKDGLTFPFAKTPIGAKRIMNKWLKTGLHKDDMKRAMDCGCNVKNYQKEAE